MMTDAYALAHGWSVLLTGGVVNLAYRGPLWAPYATAHCAPAPRVWTPLADVERIRVPRLTDVGIAQP